MPWPNLVLPPIEPPRAALSEDQMLEKRKSKGNHSHMKSNNKNTSKGREQTALLPVLMGTCCCRLCCFAPALKPQMLQEGQCVHHHLSDSNSVHPGPLSPCLPTQEPVGGRALPSPSPQASSTCKQGKMQTDNMNRKIGHT